MCETNLSFGTNKIPRSFTGPFDRLSKTPLILQEFEMEREREKVIVRHLFIKLNIF